MRLIFTSILLAWLGFSHAEEPLPPKPTLMLYYSARCPYSQRVLRFLEEIHKTLPMKNLDSNVQAKAELRDLGDRMLVPCLVIDKSPLYGADPIIDWLSEHQAELE